MNLPFTCRIALKEWAITLLSLDRGEQILLLRKGGIREEGKEFRVIYPEFLLYPTLEHQQQDLLKQAYHEDLHQVLSQPYSEDSITFTHWARAEEVIEVTEQEKVEDLSPHHIWTTDYAQKRLHWKPRKPLSIMLLRVFRLNQPQTVPYRPQYGGCKSWVTLDREVPLGALTPVLSQERFQRKIDEIRHSLSLATSAS